MCATMRIMRIECTKHLKRFKQSYMEGPPMTLSDDVLLDPAVKLLLSTELPEDIWCDEQT